MEKQYKDESVTVTMEDDRVAATHYHDGKDNFSIAIKQAGSNYQVDFPFGGFVILRTHQLRALVTFANELGIQGYSLE